MVMNNSPKFLELDSQLLSVATDSPLIETEDLEELTNPPHMRRLQKLPPIKNSEFNINRNLTNSQQEKLLELLQSMNHVISRTSADLGPEDLGSEHEHRSPTRWSTQ